MMLNQLRVRNSYLFEIAPYYPQYKIEEFDAGYAPFGADKEVCITTKVRVEHEGKWYIVHHVESLMKKAEVPFKYEPLVTKLIEQVYRTLMFVKVDTDLTNLDGKKLFPIDELQITEEERLLGNGKNNRRTTT